MSTVQLFLQEFAKTQNIDSKKLVAAWNLWFKKVVTDPVFVEPQPQHVDFDKLSFSQLKQICRDRKLPIAKKKVELIHTLKQADPNVSRLAQGAMTFYLDQQLNKHVNSETGLILDEKTNFIVGFKNPSSNIMDLLSKEQVEYCRQHNLTFDPQAIKVDNTSLVFESVAFDEESDIASSGDDN